MAETFTYRRGDEDPDLTLPWQEETSQDVWEDLNLSSGYTFTLTLTPLGSTTATVTKTSGITGGDGSVAVVWAVDELDIALNTYALNLTARETATSKDRSYRPDDPILISIVA